MGTVVKKMNYYIKQLQSKKQRVPCNEVFYLFGTASEINTMLLEKNNDSTRKYRKYPLVMLNIPSPDELRAGLVNDSLNIAIVTETEKGIKTEDRMEQNFKKVLFPLYDLFVKAVQNVGIFVWEGERDSLPGQRIVVPYWGTKVDPSTPNPANKFSDPLDAIELVDLKLNQTINNCNI